MSHYRFVHQKGLDPDDLDLAAGIAREMEGGVSSGHFPDLHYVAGSRYADAVAAFTGAFPHTKVYLYDDLRESAEGLLDDLCDFLGVGPFSFDTSQSYNRSFARRLPHNDAAASLLRGAERLRGWVPGKAIGLARRVLTRPEPEDLRAVEPLKPTFREDVRALQDVIDRDLSHWLVRYE